MDLTGTYLGKYEILGEIASGGMATVYRGRQPALDRDVAIKTLKADLLRDPKNRERFVREAKAAAQLSHPNVLTIYDADWDAERNIAYIVMEYVPGGTLKDLMGEPMLLEQVASLVEQISSGLQYAHSQGIIHRDIKPTNILLSRDNRVLIADFGLASIADSDTQITSSGEVLGTPDYMAPEQAQGTSVDARTDIFSLGVVVYEMVTGQLPYQAETAVGAMLMRMAEAPSPPRTLRPELSPDAELAILKAMAPEPDARFHDVQAFSQALKAAIWAEVSSPISAPAWRKKRKMPLQSGDVLFNGRYEIVKYLGEGAWSVVYLGYDRHLERDVALKFLHDKIARDPKEVKRFRREPRLTARIGIHPNIVNVYDFIEDEAEGISYIVMEYVDGGSLRDYLKGHQTLQTLEVVQFGIDLCHALEVIHEKDIIHCDLKPGNVMLKTRRRRLTAKVSDFGNAVIESSQSTRRPEDPTPTGYPRPGTLAYASPEQLVYKPGSDLDGRADLYSLGAILYEMVTARPPFDPNDPKPLAARIKEDPPVPPIKHNPFVSKHLEEVIIRVLSKEREGRFKDANEMREALEEVQRKDEIQQSEFKRRFNEARLVFERGDWATALDKFKAMLPAQTHDRQKEVEQYIQDCQKYIRLEADYLEAKQALAQKDWTAAVEWLKQVTRIDPDYMDGRANKELDEAMVNLLAHQQYQQALAYIDQQDWQQADRQLRETMTHFSDLMTIGGVLEGITDKHAYVERMIRLEALLREVETQIQTARISMTPEGWREVVETYNRIVVLQPDAETHRSRLEEAEQEANLATLYREATSAVEAANWVEAAAAYRRVIRIDRDYRDAAAKLTEAEDQVKCQSLRQQVDKDFADCDWLAAKEKLEEICSLLPDHQDAAAELLRELEVWLEALKDEERSAWLEAAEKLEGLTLPPFFDLKTEKIEYLRRQSELAENYQTGMMHYDKDEWRQSQRVFQQVIAIAPNYKDVPEHLRELKRRAKLDIWARRLARYPGLSMVLGIIVVVAFIIGAILLYDKFLARSPGPA
jgi:serine/threonine protein kinase